MKKIKLKLKNIKIQAYYDKENRKSTDVGWYVIQRWEAFPRYGIFRSSNQFDDIEHWCNLYNISSIKVVNNGLYFILFYFTFNLRLGLSMTVTNCHMSHITE